MEKEKDVVVEVFSPKWKKGRWGKIYSKKKKKKN